MNKECSSCGQKDRCQEIYEKLGHVKGPNVALKAIFAFAVPVVAFIIAVALTEPWLKAKIENPKLLIIAQVVLGLAAAAAILCIGKLLIRIIPAGKKGCPPKDTINKE